MKSSQPGVSRPLPEPPKSSTGKPASILKDTSKDDAEAVFAKANDRPRVLFSEASDTRSSTDIPAVVDPSEQTIKKKANLTIRPEEETRVVLGLQKAAKKQATGSLFSVIVDISKNGTLDIGVKDLPENLLVVSLLKRVSGNLGAAEEAGIRLGDVIFGINFIPTREGSKTLITVIKLETEKRKRFLHIQAWRCHQLCSDEIPGYLFPRADDMFIRGYDLFQNKVFSDWERWNFSEIILGYMVEDLHIRAQASEIQTADESKLVTFAQTGRVRARQMQALDLEKNILQAKGLRSAISARIVHTKTKDDVVTYILRVEDVESGLVWIVTRRYNEFYALYEELNEASHFLRELEFPRKRLTLRLSSKVVEQRVTMLEQYLRRALNTLTLYASMDSAASHALRRIQHFLAIEKYVDCIHPPLVDDQRAIELMAYRFLNDFNSPACQQCVRFTTSVELEGMVESGEEGYRGLLTFMHDALAEVEQFVQQQHEQQLYSAMKSRRPEWTEDQQLKLVRQCIRRQVEAALYLPLRRPLVRLLLTALDSKSKQMQKSISLLQLAKPSVFMIDPMVTKTRSFPKAIKAFRRALLAHLPADQGQFLVEAAATISEVHTECKELLRTSRKFSLSPMAGSSSGLAAALAANEAHFQSAEVVADQRSFSTIRDDLRRVSIDDPTWAYDSEDSKRRGSFGRSNTRAAQPAAQSSRRSITERFSHFLMPTDSAASSSTTTGSISSSTATALATAAGRSSVGGSERRTSFSGSSSSALHGHTSTSSILDEDELEVGLGEETQRVSFSVSAATSAMMMINIQTDDNTGNNNSNNGNGSSGGSMLSASAQKISSYVPKREHTTNLIEKRALSNEQNNQQQSLLDPKRHLFLTTEDVNSKQEVVSSDDSSETGENGNSDDPGNPVTSSTIANHENNSSSNVTNNGGSTSDLHLEAVTGVSEVTTESNSSLAASPSPPPSPLPLPFPPRSTTSATTTASIQPTQTAQTPPRPLPPVPAVSKSVSSGALFDSDDEEDTMPGINLASSSRNHSNNNSIKYSDGDDASTHQTSSSSSSSSSSSISNNATNTTSAASPVRRTSVSFAVSDNSSTANGSAANNRLSTRQLDRTSSRKADIMDPLLRPPDEPSSTLGSHSGNSNNNGSGSQSSIGANHVDSTIFAEVFDRYRSTYDPLGGDDSEEEGGINAISADDFLPIFTYVVVHAQVPQMLLLKELMVALIANEDAFGECGYYLATFEAALQHINDLASQYDDLALNDGFFSHTTNSATEH